MVTVLDEVLEFVSERDDHSDRSGARSLTKVNYRVTDELYLLVIPYMRYKFRCPNPMSNPESPDGQEKPTEILPKFLMLEKARALLVVKDA